MCLIYKYLAIKYDKVWACCTSCCDYIEMFNFIDVDWYRENVLKSDRNADDSWTKNIAVKHCEHFLFIIWLQTHRLWWFSESEHSIRGLGRWKKQRDTFNTKLNEYFLHYATTHIHGTLRGRDKDDAPCCDKNNIVVILLFRTERESTKVHRPATPVEVKKTSPSKSKNSKSSPPLSLDSPSITPLPSDGDKGKV